MENTIYTIEDIKKAIELAQEKSQTSIGEYDTHTVYEIIDIINESKTQTPNENN